MIYSLLSKNVGSHIYALLLAKVTRMPGLGGGGGGAVVMNTDNMSINQLSLCISPINF